MANCGTYIFKSAAEFRQASEGLLECPEEADDWRERSVGKAVIHHAKNALTLGTAFTYNRLHMWIMVMKNCKMSLSKAGQFGAFLNAILAFIPVIPSASRPPRVGSMPPV